MFGCLLRRTGGQQQQLLRLMWPRLQLLLLLHWLLQALFLPLA